MPKRPRFFRPIIAALSFGVLSWPLSGCNATVWKATFSHKTDDIPDAPNATAAFLKCHTQGGEVYVFESWRIDTSEEEGDAGKGQVIGVGVRYDAGRKVIGQGLLAIPIDRIVLVETNRPERVQEYQFALLGVVTVASIAGTAFCIANPKACFGSCPTFYTYDATGYEDPLRPGPSGLIQAEGFSSSIAPALETRDVDVLEDVHSDAGQVRIVMRNEALETHALRNIELIAVEKHGDEKILRFEDDYYISRNIYRPTSCHVSSTNCLQAVHLKDGVEYLSETDGVDLNSREIMEISFPALDGRRGIVISARNSLLNTFVFYQFMAWLGEDAGRWFARLDETPEGARDYLRRLTESLGDIEISVQDDNGHWVEIGKYNELGPIAQETQVIPLPEQLSEGPLRVRLEMARGHWKLDRVGLASLDGRARPLRYSPVDLQSIHKGGEDNSMTLKRLLDPDQRLFTYPGDEYILTFEVPDDGRERAFFLSSEGYYYEWMREEWIEEQHPAYALAFLLNPEAGLRMLAPAYKKVEREMEEIFWRTRIREGE